METTKFVIGLQGLEASVHPSDIYMEDEWQEADLPANYNWEHVEVENQASMKAWISLKNQWLNAAWIPNQSPEERADNAHLMKELEVKMKRLEIVEFQGHKFLISPP